MGFAALGEDYPWDSMVPFRARASEHPDGLIDLSIGTPVDPTPAVVQQALQQASNAPGYPLTAGSPALRDAIAAWFDRRRGVPHLTDENVLPTIGSKEAVGLMPSLLGLGTEDVVVHPAVAYPTYRVGALLSGATALATDDVAQWAGDPNVKVVWINSPSNPTGAVLDVPQLRMIVAAAREIGAVVISDECYAELDWRAENSTVPSVLDPAVTEGDLSNLLVAYSLSKQSSVAGYRAAFIAGDADLISRLTALRKHLGMIVPAPVQAAMTAALDDDEHVAVQRAIYQDRRTVLLDAIMAAGMKVDHSQAGLYLWARHPEHRAGCWETITWLADRGIVAGPGEFYGPQGAAHVRLALTAADTDIAAAARRLAH